MRMQQDGEAVIRRSLKWEENGSEDLRGSSPRSGGFRAGSMARGSVAPACWSRWFGWSLLALQSVHPREQKPALQMPKVHALQVSVVCILAWNNGWY